MSYVRLPDGEPKGPGGCSPVSSGEGSGDEGGGRWQWFSDRFFQEVSFEEVNRAEPYLVFYERVN